MSPPSEFWEAVERLFTEALQQPTAGRASWVANAEAPPAVRAEVQSLLAHHDAAAADDGLLELPEAVRQTLSALLEEPIPSSIGSYRIVKRLGRGGFGDVYLGEADGRMTAVKVLRMGLHLDEVLQRFRREKRMLDQFQDDRIVKVSSEGLHAGLPYLIMEYVEGQPLDRYCAQLSLDDRLRTFGEVCAAVQVAHGRGVLHCDLKPANILVTAKGTPKLLDFGIAKSLWGDEEGETQLTLSSYRPHTKAYASPEQLLRERLTPRSDVYSLGVILYELLTGQRPHSFASDNPDEIKKVLESPVMAPSCAHLGSHGLAGPGGGAECKPPPSSHPRSELDWIVLQALRKNKEHSYTSVQALGDDIANYLAGRPVLAHPDSFGYRARKTLRNPRFYIPAAVFAVVVAALAVVETFRETTAHALEGEKTARGEEKKASEAKLLAEAGRAAAERQASDNHSYANLVRAAQALAARPEEARTFLSQTPASLRSWEWHYLRNRCDAEHQVLRGHAAEVNAVAYAPSGERLASASNDGTVRIWDTRTGAAGPISWGHRGQRVRAVAWHPAGKLIASAADQPPEPATVLLWDPATGVVRHKLVGFKAAVYTLAFSPDGSRLACGGGIFPDGEVRVFDTETGADLASFQGKGHHDEVTAVLFSSDGRWLATSDRDGTRWRDATTGKVLKAIRLGEGMLAYGGRGDQWIMRTGTTSVLLYEPNTDRRRLLVERPKDAAQDDAPDYFAEEHTDRVTGLAVTTRGDRVASSSADRTTKIRDAATGRVLLTLLGHQAAVNGVCFSPDGQRVATAGADGTVRVFDTQLPADHVVGVMGVPQDLAISSQGDRIAVATHKGLALLSGHAGGPPTWLEKGKWTNRVAFGARETVLVAVQADEVRLWDLSKGAAPETLPAGGPRPRCVAFSRDGKWVAASGGPDKGQGWLRVWETATRRLQFACTDAEGPISDVAFHPMEARLASVVQLGDVSIWEVPAGKRLFRFPGNGDQVAFSPPDGRLLAVRCYDVVLPDDFVGGAVALHDAATGMRRLLLPGPVSRLAFHPDGSRLATGSFRDTIKLWDTATGREMLAIPGPGTTLGGLAFTPDGRQLVSGFSTDPVAQVRWRDAAPRHETYRLEARSLPNDLAFDPKGRWFVAVGHDVLSKPNLQAALDAPATLAVWDLRTGMPLRLDHFPRQHFLSAAFTPDGRWLLVTAVDPALAGKGLPLEGSLKVVNTETWAVERTLEGGWFAAVVPDGGRIATAGNGHELLVWSDAVGGTVVRLKGHSSKVSCAAWSPDHRYLASGSYDRTVRLWDAVTLREGRILGQHRSPVRRLAFAPTGRQLLSCAGPDLADGGKEAGKQVEVTRWDVEGNGAPLTIVCHDRGPGEMTLCRSRDFWLTSGKDAAGVSVVKAWSLEDGRQLGVTQRVNWSRITFSEDGTWLAALAPNDQVWLWETDALSRWLELPATPRGPRLP
jgi:serine/threonine-protein kinase